MRGPAGTSLVPTAPSPSELHGTVSGALAAAVRQPGAPWLWGALGAGRGGRREAGKVGGQWRGATARGRCGVSLRVSGGRTCRVRTHLRRAELEAAAREAARGAAASRAGPLRAAAPPGASTGAALALTRRREAALRAVGPPPQLLLPRRWRGARPQLAGLRRGCAGMET